MIRTSKQRILIVDGDSAFRLRLLRALRSRGFDCAGAADRVQTLAQLERTLPDIALVELRLPTGSGLEVIATIADRARTTHIVGISGLGGGEVLRAVIAAGGQQLLRKPLDVDQIVNALFPSDTHLLEAH